MKVPVFKSLVGNQSMLDAKRRREIESFKYTDDRGLDADADGLHRMFLARAGGCTCWKYGGAYGTTFDRECPYHDALAKQQAATYKAALDAKLDEYGDGWKR